MATLLHQPYRYTGVYIPWEGAPNREWLCTREREERNGFIHVEQHDLYSIVQSVATGQLYVNKMLKRGDNQRLLLPAEIRISTYPDATRRLPKSFNVRGRERIYFREIGLWQRLGDRGHSLYMKHCNGGTLEDLIGAYRRRGRAIPESFIWHLLETLMEAVRYLSLGHVPGTSVRHLKSPNWRAIYHRHITPKNIYLHYPEHDGPEPEDGWIENAFPEIILGDFGHAAIQGDPLERIAPSFWRGKEDRETKEWHDTYSIGHVAKQAFLVATGKEFEKPELCTVQEADDLIYPIVTENKEYGYTGGLSVLLEKLEYFECKEDPDVTGRRLITDDDGVERFRYNYEEVPKLHQIVHTHLPEIQRNLRNYLKPAGGIPIGWWKQLDVSWTKPRRLIPYEWKFPPKVADDDDVRMTGYSDDGLSQNPDSQIAESLNSEELRIIKDSEEYYGNSRPPFQNSYLDFKIPVMSEIRKAPPRPTPFQPEPIPPTPEGWLYVPTPRSIPNIQPLDNRELDS